MSFSNFNTGTLAYKLLTGKLRENRKHSEQLNKYLAGLLDSDGSISLKISPDRREGYYRIYLSLSLGQSASVDDDFSLLRALRDFYNLGEVYYRDVPGDQHKSIVGVWRLAHKDSLILYNRVGKHLRIKGTHWDNLVWVTRELDKTIIPKVALDELKEYSKCSRDNSRWLKHPKHLSWAWVAGFLDGDGHYRFRERDRDGSTRTEMYITFNCAQSDRFIADFFKVCFKGNVFINGVGLCIWKRNLGKESKSFAIDFLKKIRKYSCILYKYNTINKILEYHEGKLVAETE